MFETEILRTVLCWTLTLTDERHSAAAQEVSRQLPTAEAGSAPRARSCGICVGRSDTGTGLLFHSSSVCLCQYQPTECQRGLDKGSVRGPVLDRRSFTPSQHCKEKIQSSISETRKLKGVFGPMQTFMICTFHQMLLG
jgi:hypothetical protein